MLTAKRRILCVDDQPVNLALFREILIYEGYDVVIAEDGKTALNLLHAQKIDLVILDVLMPQMNGLEVCRQIRGDEDIAGIPIIMVSGLAAYQDRQRGLGAGADDFIMKPFHLTEIASRVKTMLRLLDLQEELCVADATMAAMASFGHEVIHAVESCHPDLLSGFDRLVSKVFGQGEESGVSPEIVLTGVLDKGRRKWLYYYFSDGALKRTLLATDVGWSLDLPEVEGKSLFCTGEEEIRQSLFSPLIEELGGMNIAVTTVAGYISRAFSVIAVNYRRTATKYDARVMQSLASQGILLQAVLQRLTDSDDALEHIVRTLVKVSEAGDEDGDAHIVRIGDYASLLAQDLKMHEGFIKAIRFQSQLHDIGNVYIPAAILRKPAVLTDAEFGEIKNHTLYGAQILGQYKGFQIGRNIALTHHERWDGSGYPYCLKEERIPIEGRILNIVDQYDSLRRQKIYRPAFDHDTSCRIIIEGDNRTLPCHFDPRVLTAFRTAAPRLQEIYERYSL
ncbi:MAG: response regulator [Nitrospirae bacterium]|nr:response regulator [Nitrospirota bacterium]